MKTFLLLALVLLDGALYWTLRRLGNEKTGLESRREELSLRAEARRATGEQSREIENLLENASRSLGRSADTLDIAGLRDLLLNAEKGLDLDRFSLDFRPSQELTGGREGGRISANLGGSFEAIHHYLARVEELRLPLALETLSIRADELGRILLAIDWDGLWKGEVDATFDLSASEIARLERWLERAPAPLPGRDPFGARAPSPETYSAPPAALDRASLEPPLVPIEDTEPLSPPRLTGFVIVRPELEAEVDRRVLAALRFDGELRLLGVGDPIGPYRVEEIDARESILLVDQESGERLKLYLP
jgi:hypothetical protein